MEKGRVSLTTRMKLIIAIDTTHCQKRMKTMKMKAMMTFATKLENYLKKFKKVIKVFACHNRKCNIWKIKRAHQKTT